MHIFLLVIMLMIMQSTHASEEYTVGSLTLDLAQASIKIATLAKSVKPSNFYIVFPDKSRLILGGFGGHYKNADSESETIISEQEAADWKDIIEDLGLTEEAWNPRHKQSTHKTTSSVLRRGKQ